MPCIFLYAKIKMISFRNEEWKEDREKKILNDVCKSRRHSKTMPVQI